MFYTISSIAPHCRVHKQNHQTIVLSTGFFDLLHQEHLTFLQKARAVGDILVIAVESDARARIVKGEGRPVETQAVRCGKLAPYADYVVALGDDFDNQAAYASLLEAVQPAIYAVSSHTSYLKNKAALVAKYGGRLKVVHQFNPEVSTTKLINQAIL